MSDDDDYTSSDDESSINEEFMSAKMGGVKIGGAARSGAALGVLTLQDNDDDDSEFQRPDLAPVYAEDYGEDEEEEDGESRINDDEFEGECETMESTPKMSGQGVGKKPRSKKTSTLGVGGNAGGARAKTKSIGGGVSGVGGSKKISYEDDSKKNSKKKKKKPIGICLVATKYECVRRVAKKLAFKEVEENEDWSLYWTDTSVSIDRVNQMKKWQVIKTNCACLKRII